MVYTLSHLHFFPSVLISVTSVEKMKVRPKTNYQESTMGKWPSATIYFSMASNPRTRDKNYDAFWVFWTTTPKTNFYCPFWLRLWEM